MKIIKLSNHMFKERTQSKEEWRNRFNDLKNRIDEALISGDHELAEKLDVELEEFLENADSYLFEIQEDFNEEEDLEPEDGDGTHYAEMLAPLYEGYLMAKEGEYIDHRFSEGDDLENVLARLVIMIMVDYVDVNMDDYFFRDGGTYVGMTPYGKRTTFVRDFRDEVKSEKVGELIKLARNVWEEKVELLRKLNPNWGGYYGYLGKYLD